ncbi:MAG: hypothetical protein JNM17_30655 [Archangium sp.]|nr:hypothetical protein [Archangium sp.]
MAAVLLTALSATAAPPREAELRAVLSSEVTRITARLAPNKSGAPAVGILSATTAPPGDQWIATLWQSAFIASEATQTSLLAHEFSFKVNAPVLDGSAGLLTASTFVALIRNKKVLANTTMVGAINPDGSAAFADEVLARLRAAATDGVKRFGVPLGARQQPGAEGEPIDVVLEGQRLGVEVRELSGLDDAYLFLTGDTLTRPTAAAETDMELWPAELAAMSRSTTELRKEFETERATLETMLDGGVSPTSANALRTRLERFAKQATDSERGGDSVRAYVLWGATLTTTRVAIQDVQFLQSREPFGLLQAQGAALTTERAALQKELETRFPPSNRANDMYAMDVLESLVTQNTSVPTEQEAKSGDARQLAEGLLRAREDVRNGQRFVALYASLPKLKKTLPPLDAARLSTSYGAARSTVAMKELANDAELRGYERQLFTEMDPRARLVLAARQNIYTAHVINLYRALGAEVSDKGVLTVRNPRVLSSQLEHARTRVLQACGRAGREATMVPLAAKLRYLNARAGREGTERQKVEALADLWVANWWCELAVSGSPRASR